MESKLRKALRGKGRVNIERIEPSEEPEFSCPLPFWRVKIASFRNPDKEKVLGESVSREMAIAIALEKIKVRGFLGF